jgi:hypothetical protein
MKVARSNNIDSRFVAGGAGKAAGIMTKFMSKFIPKLQKTKNPKEGARLLWSELKAEITGGAGLEVSKWVWEDIKKNTQIEYKNGRVCIKYRKFKKCMKVDRK